MTSGGTITQHRRNYATKKSHTSERQRHPPSTAMPKAVLICPHQLQFYQTLSSLINSSLIYPPHDTANENINVKLKADRTMALSFTTIRILRLYSRDKKNILRLLVI